MRERFEVRYFLTALLLASLLLVTACSKLTSFVLVNASDSAVEVRYRLKHKIDPRLVNMGLHMIPAVKELSELDEDGPWQDLSVPQFEVDADNRTITVTLMPGKALRVEQLNLRDDPDPATSFDIEALSIKGASGEVRLQGEQLYMKFVDEDYTLTYR